MQAVLSPNSGCPHLRDALRNTVRNMTLVRRLAAIRCALPSSSPFIIAFGETSVPTARGSAVSTAVGRTSSKHPANLVLAQ